MTVFGNYSKFYDAIYAEKDYEGECAFLVSLFERFGAGTIVSVLDLGCGTGGHALRLAAMGYDVHGVDRSPEMLAVAADKTRDRGVAVALSQGDLCDVRLGRTFDAVVSNFAVMSYLTENDQLTRAFATVRKHLVPGGLFVFDAWFGPGVFTDPPGERCKSVTQDGQTVIRIAVPRVDAVRQVVTVQYKVLHVSADQTLHQVDEVHAMRPFFVQEVTYLAGAHGLELITAHPFMALDRSLSANDWNASFVLRAV